MGNPAGIADELSPHVAARAGRNGQGESAPWFIILV